MTGAAECGSDPEKMEVVDSDRALPPLSKEGGINEKSFSISVEEEERKARRLKYWQTATYCATYISQGMAGGCVGPTLLLLAENTNSGYDDMGLVFAVRGIGWVIGCLCAGKLYELALSGEYTLRSHWINLASLIGMSGFLCITPFATNLWLMLALQWGSAFFTSWNDVGANCLLFAVWQKEVNPYMQLLHFAYGVGASSSPFIIALVIQYLAPKEQELLWSYWVLGAIIITSAILVITVESPTAAAPVSKVKEGEETVDTIGWVNKLIIFLTAASLFLYVGAELTYGGWIFTYAVNLGISEVEADYLSSAFWIAITLGRLLAVPLSSMFSSRTILLVDHIGSTATIIVAVLFAALGSRLIIWIVTLVYGLCMASLFAMIFSFPSQLGVTLTSRATSVQIVGSSLGATLVPMVGGYLFALSPSLLLWLIMACNVAMVLIYFLLAYGVTMLQASRMAAPR